MAFNLPDTVWIVICKSGVPESGGVPSNCSYEAVQSSVFHPLVSDVTNEQFNEFLGLGIGVVITIIIVALIKKAIEI